MMPALVRRRTAQLPRGLPPAPRRRRLRRRGLGLRSGSGAVPLPGRPVRTASNFHVGLPAAGRRLRLRARRAHLTVRVGTFLAAG